jgi:hypothetical protein
MALRGKKPTAIEKRLKALMFGPAGSGKTTAAIQFPRPYLIDTERGAENRQYVELLEKAGGAYFGTADFEEMLTEVTSLLSEKHPYRTVIIDPITVVYNDLLNKSAAEIKRTAKEKDATGTEFGRHYALADSKMRHLLNLLLRLDMNVIITCHAKTLYGENLTKLGETFDGYKKLDYLFDLVIEIQKRGVSRVGVIRKTRIETLPENMEIKPWDYGSIADLYGRAILERDAMPEVLASPDQVAQLTHLIEVLKLPEDTVTKWLDKANAATLSELPADAAAKCIDHCKKQIEKAA